MSFIGEDEWCDKHEAPTVIVDDHEEGDYRLPNATFRVLDLACGHSISRRLK